MTKRPFYAAAIFLVAFASLPLFAIAHETASVMVTAAAKGTFPSGTTYRGVPLSGLRFGTGVEIPGDTSAAGRHLRHFYAASAQWPCCLQCRRRTDRGPSSGGFA